MLATVLPNRLQIRFAEFFFAGAVALFLAGCGNRARPEHAEGASISSTSPSQVPEQKNASYQAKLPRRGGPPGYVGSDACRKCHEDQYGSWHRSYHRTMTQVAGPQSIQANFHDVILTNENARFILHDRGGIYSVRMEPLVQMSSESGPPPGLEVRIGLVTGSHNMQVFWVPEGHGNMQVGFPFTWLIPEKRWVPRNSTFVRPPDTVHTAEMWNIVCSRCHATGIEPHVTIATRRVDTEAAELGISCEACHGPGERHVKARTKFANTAPAGTRPVLPPGEIVHPRKISAERSAQICGFCHSMKWIPESEEWRENGFRYRPGDDLEKTTPVIRPARTAEVPGLADYLARHSDILEDFFWPDGMVRVSGRDYNGLIESPCYKGGKFSCLSCHSMHESEPVAQLAERGKSNTACTQCHEQFRDPAHLAAHTHHSVNSSGSECYNCHMPRTTYGVLKAIRSHQISSPSAATEIATGRPSACNLCHLDQSLDWTARNLAHWFHQPAPALPENAASIADSVRLALSGDAGQRVLAAWHFGWDEALKTSGRDWAIPVLAQLLDDPYAAVRCAAERSMRKISGPLPPGFDFSVDPRTRPPVREYIWEKWTAETPGFKARPATLVTSGDPRELERNFDPWLKRRDDRPVRLRE